MTLTFVYPQYLWLFLILPLAFALAWITPRYGSRARYWLGVSIRMIIFALLIVSLAGIQIRFASNTLTTVFILDASDSISPEQRARGEKYIQDALLSMNKETGENQAAIVVFGENALVEQLSSAEARFSSLTSVPVTTRTDIAGALQLAQAIFPGEGAKRMILLSDGRENIGQAVGQAELASASQIELDYVPLGSDTGPAEVFLDSLEAPGEIRQGQDFHLTANIDSSAAMMATLRIFQEGSLSKTIETRLLPGSNRIEVPISASMIEYSGSFIRFSAQILPEFDTRLQNNEASAFTIVQGPPSVLVVEGRPGEGASLAASLREASMKVDQVSGPGMPSALSELASYESVILVNLPASELPSGAMETLQVYVRDLGKGLLMIGGDQAFGAGGFLRTPLEKALPVDMDVRDKEIQSNLALILVVDKSGSMGRCHCDNPDLNQTYTAQLSGQPKVDIAKEAVMRAAAAMGDQDYLGVLGFDSQPRWAVDVGPLIDPFSLERSISVIQAEGQTNLQAGVEAAYQALQNVQARNKQIILLTDGWVRTGDLTNLAQEINSQGITLSIVAAGEGSAEYLHSLAVLGGGQYYAATDIQSVPDIFLKETIKSIGKYIIEGAFYPVPASPSPILSGLDPLDLPPLLGYNGTSAKKTARIDLVTPQGDPLLASWQYGLGRAAVWTSDLKGQWAVDWMKWAGFGRFAAQLVSWTLPSRQLEGMSFDTGIMENQAYLQVDATSQDGSPLSFLSGSVSVVDPKLVSQEIPLKQIGAGRYRAEWMASTPGVYLMRVGVNDADQSFGQATLGLVVPYSPEYKLKGIDLSLLERLAQLTGGSELISPKSAFENPPPSLPASRQIWLQLLMLAAVLFPLDVAVRRLSINRKDLTEALSWLKSRWSSTPSQAVPQPQLLANLFEARRRAFQKMGIVKDDRETESTAPAKNADASSEVGMPNQEPEINHEVKEAQEDTLARLKAAKKRARR